MSRIFIMVSKPHDQLMPVLSITTGDHTGGTYTIGGLHPSTIAKLVGHGPKVEVKEGERFDLRCFLNKKRIAFLFIINTTKHFPHVQWSSSDGLGALPLGLHQYAPAFLLKPESKPGPKAKGDTKESSGRVHRRDRHSLHSTASSSSDHRRRDEYKAEEYDEEYNGEKGYDREFDNRPQIKARREGDEKDSAATEKKSNRRGNPHHAIEQKHGQQRDCYGIEQRLVRQWNNLHEAEAESDSEYDRVQEKRHSRKRSPPNSDDGDRDGRDKWYNEYNRGYDRRTSSKSRSYNSDDGYNESYSKYGKTSERRYSRNSISRGSDDEYDSRYDKCDRRQDRRHYQSSSSRPHR